MFFVLEECTEVVLQVCAGFFFTGSFRKLARLWCFLSNAVKILSVTRQLPSRVPCVTDFFYM